MAQLTEITGTTSPIYTMSANLSSLCSLLEVFSLSLDKNQELIKFLDNISNGNIRFAIDYVKQFFGSGHVDTSKILALYNEQGYYIIPLHEFVRAIMRGNGIHFNPNSSSISNLFDVTQNDEKEHFLMPTLLELLQANAFGGKNDGFLTVKQIYTSLQGLGFNTLQIDDLLTKCFEDKLIESSSRGDIIEDNHFPSMIRITTLGSYHITNLIDYYAYIDSVIVDTPVFDEEIREQIKAGGSIHQRIIRAKLFITYLDNVWEKINFIDPIYKWPKNSKSLKEQISQIEERIN